jgi:hypothetical protein
MRMRSGDFDTGRSYKAGAATVCNSVRAAEFYGRGTRNLAARGRML